MPLELIPLSRLKKALEEVGGSIWFFIDLEPSRTVYTLTLCGGTPCVMISGQDMSPIQLALDEYVKIEMDRRRLDSLRYTIKYLLEKT
jgi:NADH:ubiquinone oxidoreductase subunit E